MSSTTISSRPPGLWILCLFLAGRSVFAQPPASPIPDVQGIGLADAVRLMLRQDPNLSIEESRLRSSRGVLLATQGAFDPVVQTSLTEEEVDDPLSESTSRQQSLLTNSLGMTKRFRTGLSIEPTLQLQRTAEDDPAVNVGTVAFTFRQPLLRGRGRTAAAAPELSAERQVSASELDLRQRAAERALAVVSQYWQARAALLNAAILEESEARARELLETTRKLIDADVTPAADLIQVEANVVAKETARIGGERELFEARQALGREIGLPPERIASLPAPSDPFPLVQAASLPAATEGADWIARALERRADLRAARERRGAAEILLRAADNFLKPQLDLVFTPSYSGLVQGAGTGTFFSPLYRNVPGAGSVLSMSLSWPTLNRQARGELVQADAVREQSALLEDLISRQIGANVPIALDAVARGSLQLERAAEAVRLFERVVENEEKKLRAGTSTLIDVISQRDRLTSARQSQVSSHLALAIAVARLRFETGTLVPDLQDVQSAQLTTIPFGAGGEP